MMRKKSNRKNLCMMLNQLILNVEEKIKSVKAPIDTIKIHINEYSSILDRLDTHKDIKKQYLK